ncbi:hypothetical protein EHM69_00540 [candidate division KSB1 bacterium]|nr:MAG: hypothetical protein EHM69_00540 [candidate division KSB1 bacterium]
MLNPVINSRRVFLALIVIGAILRVMMIQQRPADAILRAPDEGEYVAITYNLAHGHGFALNGEQTAYRDMLFPVVASVVFRLTGDSIPLVLYLQVILSVTTGMLIYRLGRTRFSESVALVMAAVWIFYPAAVIFSALFLTETLFVFLWVLALVLHDRLNDRGYRTPDAALLGLALGLVMLARAVGMILLVAVLVYIALIRYEAPRKDRWRAVLIVLAASLIVTVPWMIRNAMVLDRFALNTNGGINLLIGNNPRATGTYLFDEDVQGLLPPAERGEAARDRAGTAIARDYMREHKRETVDLWGRKFAYLWATDMSLWAHYLPVRDTSLREHLRSLPLLWLILAALPYMLIVSLGVSGFYLVRHFPARGIFILQLFLGVMAACMSYGLARYHFPYIPACIVGAGALYKPRVWKDSPPWRRLLLLFILGLFLGIWLLEIMTIAGI